MGTVPISVIYGFEYPLNGFDQGSKSKTRAESLHKSDHKKGFMLEESVNTIKKTRGCLAEIKRTKIDLTTQQITGEVKKTKGCLTDIKKYQKPNHITSSRATYKVNPYKERSFRAYSTSGTRCVYKCHVQIPNKSWYWRKKRVFPHT